MNAMNMNMNMNMNAIIVQYAYSNTVDQYESYQP